jgi:DNA recombination protein RmuC
MVHPEGMNLETILLAAASLLALMAAIGAWRPRREGEALARRVEESASRSRTELQHFLAGQLAPLREEMRLARLDQGASLEALQDRVQERLERMGSANEQKLEEMRRTVDERLQATLEQRLGASFRLVSERLEQVQRGLGEMQALAQDVGGLKRALTNVKNRGILGEAQLGALLEQYLAPGQYAANVRVKPRGPEVVEYAVKLPGSGEGEHVWLPIDAKFPLEDYQRLGESYEAGDPAGIEAAGKALELRLLAQAREVRDKYIAPPGTTDFALLFLPFEGLFAEALRRPGLLERLQRECRVSLVGPTTLTAFLNSLQVGFRTLAITKRSSEVWRLLAGVKADFGKFGEALQAVDRKLDEARSKLGAVSERSRILGDRLARVESLPD